jgi:mevalonate kinase
VPAFTASAPGKIILFGEHAVVYGQPAIAVPVIQVQARAVVTPEPGQAAGRVRLQAPGIGLDAGLARLPADDPLAAAVRGVFAALGVQRLPALSIRVTSTIPIAAGLGSGAAVSVAVIRALSACLGHPLDPEQVSALAFEVEKLHHGTPSGIDNTVITFARPVYFVRAGDPERRDLVETFPVPRPFSLVIGDTGVPSPTALAVGDVRWAWQAEPARYEALFAAAGRIAAAARQAIEEGRTGALGPLMDENQALLRAMRVSSPELEALIGAARAAGALGAKLSGGGRGGNMIALVEPEQAEPVARALRAAGATHTITTLVR